MKAAEKGSTHPPHSYPFFLNTNRLIGIKMIQKLDVEGFHY